MTTDLNSLSSSELRVKVAEKLGYVECIHWTLFHAFGSVYAKGSCGHEKCYPREIGPAKFDECLNACAEMEKVLDKEGVIRYQAELVRLVCNPKLVKSDDKPWCEGFLFHATARQRCLAFLKV